MEQSCNGNMQILNEIAEYADKCLHDVKVSEYEDYISGKKHKNACKRLLLDIERMRSPSCSFYWDEEEAQKIVGWFGYLRHSKGELAGQPIILTTWQKFLLCQLYGWRMKKTGHKRFHKLFVEVGRKNAKSQMIAGVMLYEIAVSATKNSEAYEAYTTGVKREQSFVIYNECDLMLKNSPLRQKFKIQKREILHRRSGSFLKMLSKDDKKTGDGTNPAVLCVDELHQHPTMEFVDLFLGANTKDPTLIIITTAGKDLTYPCYTVEYAYCSKVIDPNDPIADDEYLVDICEVDQEDIRDLSNISNERLWWKANPIRMSYESGREKMRSAFRKASVMPDEMIAFETKVLNIWVQAKENGYMDMSKWKDAQADISLDDTKSMPVYIGFDMSAKIDLTSVSFVFPVKTSDVDSVGKEIIRYLVFSHSFIPTREKLMEHVTKDRAPYDAWEQQGFITITETPIVDQSTVMRYVMELANKYQWDVKCLCFDPANASKLMLDLSNEGYDVEEVYQSHKALNEATQGFREQVYSGNVLHDYNPVLTYAMSNAVVRQHQGLIKIDKDASTKRIDPVDAVLCGFKLAMYHEFEDSYLDEIDAFLAM